MSPAKVIWKFELGPRESNVMMPEAAEVLAAGAQGNNIVVWVLCLPGNMRVARRLKVHATGAPDGFDGERFVGTVQMDDGLVFHVFDLGEL